MQAIRINSDELSKFGAYTATMAKYLPTDLAGNE